MTKDEALKMAIEVMQAFDSQLPTNSAKQAIQACKEALEQPSQEPVSKTAERDYNFMRDLAIGTEDILNEMLSAKPVAVVAVDNFGNISVGWNKKPQHNDKLYTHPASSWQGLNPDEIQKCYEKNTGAWVGFYDQIEQALKEKNNGS